MYLSGLPLFFFKTHDSQVWSFIESLNSCIFLSQLLSYMTKISSVFSLISILSLNSEILSSTCFILLEWPSTVFFD
jgi:hypothetical protein